MKIEIRNEIMPGTFTGTLASLVTNGQAIKVIGVCDEETNDRETYYEHEKELLVEEMQGVELCNAAGEAVSLAAVILAAGW